MGANLSNWSSQLPSGDSSIRDSDDQFRSHQSILEATLNDEHFFNSASSASCGIHRPGSARIFSGVRSALSTPASADSANRLFYATDTGALLYLAASSMSTIAQGNSQYSATVTQNQLPIPDATWTWVATLSSLTSEVPGLYLVKSSGIINDSMSSTGANSYLATELRLGSTVIARNYGPCLNGSANQVPVTGWTAAASGTTFSVWIYQNSGSAHSSANITLSIVRL